MLFLKKPMLLLVLCLTVAAANAQETPTAVFKDYASSITLDESMLRSTFAVTKGQQVNLAFGNLQLAGETLSNQQVYDNLQTVIFRSAAFKNAVIQVSRQINADRSENFVGRIIAPGASDGYEIKRNAEGKYYLQKFEIALVRQDCNMQ